MADETSDVIVGRNLKVPQKCLRAYAEQAFVRRLVSQGAVRPVVVVVPLAPFVVPQVNVVGDAIGVERLTNS